MGNQNKINRSLPIPPAMDKAVRRALRPPPPVARRSRCGEVAGGTAADCAAVFCCCPCGLLNLLVLAMVRLPAGHCRRALRRRRKKDEEENKKITGTLRSRVRAADDDEVGARSSPMPWSAKSPALEISEKEKEMWAHFYSTGGGFGRSPSQRQ